MTVRLIVGNCKSIPLADESVHCVVTSPPYWGLRDYGIEGQLGLERTPEEYLTTMVEIFREVRRVMRPDATLWLNMGDCYAASVNGRSAAETKAIGTDDRTFRDKPFSTVVSGLKPKDLVGMPWRLAFALQSDGWWLRQDIVWNKPNPMPESIIDRCTKSHEYIFLMTKSPRYFFDPQAIKEPVSAKTSTVHTTPRKGRGTESAGEKVNEWIERNGGRYHPETRAKRSVWTVATKAFKDAHFATFPPDLIAPCIKAGTSEGGCCSACGAPYMRLQRRIGPGGTELIATANERYARTEDGRSLIGDNRIDPAPDAKRHETTTMPLGTRASFHAYRGVLRRIDIGWQSSCACEASIVACTVFDPFAGSGTTGVVADALGRDAVLIELNPTYAQMALRRLKNANPFSERFFDHVCDEAKGDERDRHRQDTTGP